MTRSLEPDPTRAAALHEALMRWLAREHPTAPVLDVVGALTYEIGRIVGQLTADASEREIDETLDRVRQQMRGHIAAWRAGLRS